MFNSFVKATEIPTDCIVAIRISDNVLEEEDWTPITVIIDGGVVTAVDDDDEYFTRMVGWAAEELAEWTQYDSTGQHPEAYHELKVMEATNNTLEELFIRR